MANVAIRWTTPSIKLMVPEAINLREASIVHATFIQGKVKIIKTKKDIQFVKDNLISVPFTQEETAQFSENSNVDVQINWVYSDGKRNATNTESFRFGRQLEEEVLTNE